MASSNFFILIDDIAALLDDVAIMSKVAVKKTAGVLGDDLALNAEQVSGVKPDRELPVVWAVAKGSFINKCILVPAALLISAFIPWAIAPILMAGGSFLCFEGFEKVFHKIRHAKSGDDARHHGLVTAISDPKVDMLAFEKEKIKNAIRTDAILSAEIIAIILGTVAHAPFLNQVLVLIAIPLLITVGVYGLVAGIVKLDDAGLILMAKSGEHFFTRLQQFFGRQIVRSAPHLMKSLTIIGTAAMFLVGGGILTHGTPLVHHFIQHTNEAIAATGAVGHVASLIYPVLADAIVGIVAGGILLCVVTVIGKVKGKLTNSHQT